MPKGLSPEETVVRIHDQGGLACVPHPFDRARNGSRLQTPQQFEAIILKSRPDGSVVKLSDVARVELGAESYTTSGVFNGMPAAGIGISLAGDANAMDTAAAVQSTIDNLRGTLPPNVQVTYPYDTTPFVRLSIEQVVMTLFYVALSARLVQLILAFRGE